MTAGTDFEPADFLLSPFYLIRSYFDEKEEVSCMETKENFVRKWMPVCPMDVGGIER